MHRWAFEFLRRNQEFEREIAGISRLAGPKNDPHSPFRKRWREIADQFGIAHAVLKEWKLDSPVRFKVAPYFLESGIGLPSVGGKFFVGADNGSEAALAFDLRRSIAPQLRAAEKLLKGFKRSGVVPTVGAQRDRRANYALMLRTLDARAANVAWATQATVLLPKKTRDSAVDHLKKIHARAKQLRDGGYRHLPALKR